MPRKKRVICPGCCYHVMMRGVSGRSIFDDDKDRVHFCLLLQYASEICKFNIHGFCLMGNHIHLLLEPQTKDLASGMHRLTFRYAQYYNKKVERQGYLFQSRYKAIIVQHGIYLRRLIRYIHRNPVRANLVKNLSYYPWSSHQAYVGDLEFTWLKKDLVLSLFGSEPQVALQSFNHYVYSEDAEAKNDLEEIRNSIRVGAYGSDLFVEEFQNELKSDRVVLGLDISKNEISFECLLDEFKKVTAISLEEMQSPSKERSLVDARALLVLLFLKLKLGSTKDLADLLRREATSIARLKERIHQSTKLLKLADEITSKLIEIKIN